MFLRRLDLVDGTYGLYGDLQNAPNGAFYRGDDSAFVWFIVDNQAPRVAAVDRPGFNTMLSEEDWKDLQFELRLDENAQLDETSLRLHWSLNEAGLGLNSYVFDNGKVPCCVDARGADPVPENDSHGEFVFLAAETYRYTGDEALLRQVWPQVQKAVAYMDELRVSTRTAAFQTPDQATGKLPYTGSLQTIRKVAAEESFLALYNGFLPYYLRCGGHTVCMFIFVQIFRDQYSKNLVG